MTRRTQRRCLKSEFGDTKNFPAKKNWNLTPSYQRKSPRSSLSSRERKSREGKKMKEKKRERRDLLGGGGKEVQRD